MHKKAALLKSTKRWCSGTPSSSPGLSASHPQTAWKRGASGLPSVAEIKWDERHGGANSSGSLHGVPERIARTASLEAQREYLENKEALSMDPLPRTAGRHRKWRESLRQKVVQEARDKQNAGSYSDEVTLTRLTNHQKTNHTTIDRRLFDSISGVDRTLPTVVSVFAAVEGVDPAVDVAVVHSSSPDMCFITNSNGSGKERGAIRETLRKQDFSPSLRWYAERRKTVVIISETGSLTCVEWAKRCPDVTFIVVCDTVSSLFRCVSDHTEDGMVPDNIKHVRTRPEFYFLSDECVPDASIHEIRIEFPRPMLSSQGSSKRIPHAELLAVFHQKLAVGGVIEVSSGSSGFIGWVNEQFERCQAPFVKGRTNGTVSALLEEMKENADGDTAIMPFAAGMSIRSKDANTFGTEWIKREATPEMVHDKNAEYSFTRRSFPSIKA